MNCHICGQPATGQCRVCWKFYCPTHGDLACQPCQQQRTAGRGGSEARMVLMGHGEGSGAARSRPLRLDRRVPIRIIEVIDTAKHGGTELTLISLETYEDAFSANFHLRFGSPSEDSLGFGATPHFQTQASDDLGVSYESSRGRGGGGDENWRLTQNFTPNLAVSARHLYVSIEQIEIQWLRGGPGDSPATKSGPWAFDVRLE